MTTSQQADGVFPGADEVLLANVFQPNRIKLSPVTVRGPNGPLIWWTVTLTLSEPIRLEVDARRAADVWRILAEAAADTRRTDL